jgi:hypothetical protein
MDRRLRPNRAVELERLAHKVETSEKWEVLRARVCTFWNTMLPLLATTTLVLWPGCSAT